MSLIALSAVQRSNRTVSGTQDPGAPRQRLHADTKFDNRGSLLTAFIALNDVDSDMGGTLHLPGTANPRGQAVSLSHLSSDLLRIPVLF